MSSVPGEAQGSSRLTLLLTCLLVVQVGLLIYVLILFTPLSPTMTMRLETPEAPPGSLKERNLLVDTINCMAADELLDRDPQAGAARQELVFDEGQFIWAVLRESVKPDAPILDMESRLATYQDRTIFRQLLTDGIVSFLFNLGAQEDTFRYNWGIATRELQQVSLLPWAKRVDFVVLSDFNDDHRGGLDHLLKLNPSLLILTPPLPNEDEDIASLFTSFQNALPLPPGYTPLTERIGVLVLAVNHPGGLPSTYEASVLVDSDAGITILAGSGAPSAETIITQAAQATGRPIINYLGGTNLAYGQPNDPRLQTLKALLKQHPGLTFRPGYNTSLAAHEALSRTLGSSYQPLRLGSRIMVPWSGDLARPE